MQFFTQDDNFEMMHLTEDESIIDTIESFDLPWEESGDVVEKTVQEMKQNKKIRVNRHLHVTQNYAPKYKKYTPTAEFNYEQLIGPFFASYMQEYVERQDGKYDELLATVRKLLKVKITGKTTKKHIYLTDTGKYFLTCIDITKDKATWRKDDYKMVLRYFEFSITQLQKPDAQSIPESSIIETPVNTVVETIEFPIPGPVPTMVVEQDITVDEVPAVPDRDDEDREEIKEEPVINLTLDEVPDVPEQDENLENIESAEVAIKIEPITPGSQ